MMCSSTSSDSSNSRVTFTTVEFKSHAMILGNNPSTRVGPSIEIHWDEFSRASCALEEYESMRPPRRAKHELLIPRPDRESILIDCGYTMEEIEEENKLRNIERGQKVQKPGLLKGMFRKRS